MTTRRQGVRRIAATSACIVLLLLTVTSISASCRPTPAPSPTPGPSPTPRPTRTSAGRPVARFYPASKPSATRGVAIYGKDCAACHGATGKGDGIVGRPLRPKPSNFTDLDYMRQQRPDWFYQAVTKGVLGSAMLAFDGALDEGERWDVTLYVWSLATSPEAIEAGRQLYTEYCASCHGPSGDGQGASVRDLETSPPDLSDPRTMFARTSEQLFSAINQSTTRLPDHAWPELSDDQRWTIIDYVWTFMYDTIRP